MKRALLVVGPPGAKVPAEPVADIGQQFDAIVTGCFDAATWVCIFAPQADGRLARVKRVLTDVERGFIDFVRVD